GTARLGPPGFALRTLRPVTALPIRIQTPLDAPSMTGSRCIKSHYRNKVKDYFQTGVSSLSPCGRGARRAGTARPGRGGISAGRSLSPSSRSMLRIESAFSRKGRRRPLLRLILQDVASGGSSGRGLRVRTEKGPLPRGVGEGLSEAG